jgi:hypothetical protein
MSGVPHPLLEEALTAHGGHDRWRSFTGISEYVLF